MEGRAKYDLEERLFEFARDVRNFVQEIPKTDASAEDAPQAICASGSVGSNYIAANNALRKKDFLMRLRIRRKEAKESRFFLRLIDVGESAELESERTRLMDESQQLAAILGSMITQHE